jgi:methyl-accepting chemotaxis protein
MAVFANLGISQKIGILCVAGALVSAVTGAVGIYAQEKLTDQAEQVRSLESANGRLHRLGTRESELKVDAYRALAEPDVAAIIEDLPGDLDSVTETLAEIDAITLPADIRADVEAIKPDAVAFNTFIDAFVRDAAKDQQSVRPREPEIADRNHDLDDKISGLQDKIDARIVAERAEMADTRTTTRWITVASVAAGIVLFLFIAIPILRAIVRPVRRVRTVLEALARGDLTQTAGVVGKDEIGQMASCLDLRGLRQLRRPRQRIGAAVEGQRRDLRRGVVHQRADGRRVDGVERGVPARQYRRDRRRGDGRVDPRDRAQRRRRGRCRLRRGP